MQDDKPYYRFIRTLQVATNLVAGRHIIDDTMDSAKSSLERASASP